MYIIDGGRCEIGIESTVVKIDGENGCAVTANSAFGYKELEDFAGALSSSDYKDDDNRWKKLLDHIQNISTTKTLTILRKGAITLEMLRTSLRANVFKNIKVEHKVASLSNKQICESPGMLLRHYSPNVPTYRVSLDNDEGINDVTVETMVMIDIGGKFKDWRDQFAQYIKVTDNSYEVAKRLYSVLREAESFAMDSGECIIAIYYENKHGDLDEAIHDRIYRATSGKSVYCKVTNEIKFKC